MSRHTLKSGVRHANIHSVCAALTYTQCVPFLGTGVCRRLLRLFGSSRGRLDTPLLASRAQHLRQSRHRIVHSLQISLLSVAINYKSRPARLSSLARCRTISPKASCPPAGTHPPKESRPPPPPGHLRRIASRVRSPSSEQPTASPASTLAAATLTSSPAHSACSTPPSHCPNTPAHEHARAHIGRGHSDMRQEICAYRYAYIERISAKRPPHLGREMAACL